LEHQKWDEKDSGTLSALDVELKPGGLDSEAFRGFLACFPYLERFSYQRCGSLAASYPLQPPIIARKSCALEILPLGVESCGLIS
jgi:hypothetical protein